MVNYKCPRCGYEINIKTKYSNHLRRKNICEPLLSNNNLHDEYIKYNISDKIIISSNNPQNPQNASNYECNFCEKNYSRKDNLIRHLKKCKEKDKEIEFKQDMVELVNRLNIQLTEQQEEFKKVLEKRDKQIDVLIKKTGMNINNSVITQNIQQNIKLLAYNNSDISHLTDKDFLKCINHSNFCVPHLIKKIHFDPNKPENHNVYISNIKNKYIMTYDGNKWNLQNEEETIDDLIDKNEFFLEQKLEEWVENGKDYPEIMKKFNRYLERKEEEEVLKKIKNEIKLMLFNNRKMISI